MIRIAEPDIGKAEEELVLEAIRSGRLTQGPLVERFEKLTAAMAGTDHAVALCNGTAALELALEALGVGKGDEVITTPFTFVATLNAILKTGATPRFAEIGPDLNLDPDAVEALIGPRTAAVLAVHLYGNPADAPKIMGICDAHDLAFIEDAAQAHGATIEGRPVGSFGLGTFSFYATKNVTAGEGGAITTSSMEVTERLRLLRNQGMKERYQYELIGSNRRMTEIQAALAIPQLERLPSILVRRGKNAATLSEILGTAVETPMEREGYRSAWHQYTVLLPNDSDRDVIAGRMLKRGVETGIYYPRLVWDYLPFDDIPKDRTPQAEAISRRCLSLPVHQRLSRQDLEEVAEALLVSL